MKHLFFLLFISLGLSLYGTDRYFSNDGDDEAAGTSIAPWLHPNNHSYSTGDVLYFNRGDVWDTVHITSQFDNLNIYIDAYGSGAQPELTGSLPAEGFVNISGNVYYQLFDSDFPRGGEIFFPNGMNWDGVWQKPAGSDVLDVTESSSDYNTVVLEGVSFNTNEFSYGSFLAGQPVKWQWHTIDIGSNTSNTIELNSDFGGGDAYYSMYGTGAPKYAVIWNSDRYLDADKEWTFRGDTLRVYSLVNPNTDTVRFTMIDTIISQTSGSLYIKNVTIRDANHILVSMYGGTTLQADTCIFANASGYAIRSVGTDNLYVKNCRFTDILDHAINTESNDDIEVESNYCKRIGITMGLANYHYGAGGNHGGCFKQQSLMDYGSAVYQYNFLDSVGLATQFFSDRDYTSTIFKYNWVQNYGHVHGDCGALYTASEVWTAGVNRLFKNDFVINSVSFGIDGRYTGYNTNPVNHPAAIYHDLSSLLIRNDSITIENCQGVAVKLNRSYKTSFNHSNVVRTATLMNNDFFNVYWYRNQGVGVSYMTSSADRDTVKYNQFVMDGRSLSAPISRETTTEAVTSGQDNNYFYIDYNKYAYPFGTYTNVGRYIRDYGSTYNTYSLTQMQSAGSNLINNLNQDVNSSQHMHNDYSAKSGSISATGYAKVFKNFSTSSHDFTLNGTYRDIDSSLITTSISVPAMYSKILFWQSGDTSDVDFYIDSSLVYLFPTYVPSEEEPPPTPPTYYFRSVTFSSSEIVKTTVSDGVVKYPKLRKGGNDPGADTTLVTAYKFNMSNDPDVSGGWVSLVGVNGSFSNQEDSTGTPKTIDLAFSTFSGQGTSGYQSGDNSCYFPDSVIKGYNYLAPGQTAGLVISGLTEDYYKLEFMGSRNDVNRQMQATIGATTLTIYADNNCDSVATFYAVPSSGSITVSFSAPTYNGYLNAFRIKEYTIECIPWWMILLTLYGTRKRRHKSLFRKPKES